jgi:hypothetical protein
VKTTLELVILEKIPDFDSDGIPDDIDPDDDNDGIPDVWEELFGFNPKNPADASSDPDSDQLTNLEEYLNDTEPKNADTDNEGLLDGEEVLQYLTDPKNPDTDGDKLDDYNDPYPLDPTRPGSDDEVHVEGPNYQAYTILAIVIILIIIIIISMVIRKRRGRGSGQISEPYAYDTALREVRDEILTDAQDQNLKLSRSSIKSKLDDSSEKNEISEETYKYINEQILQEEAESEE